jgi:uncharacterized protein YdeI (YjbR/CyaY-like superfamily)
MAAINLGPWVTRDKDHSLDTSTLVEVPESIALSMQAQVDSFNQRLQSAWWRRELHYCYNKRKMMEFENCIYRMDASQKKENTKVVLKTSWATQKFSSCITKAGKLQDQNECLYQMNRDLDKIMDGVFSDSY